MVKDWTETVLDFLEGIEKCSGQKILEFHSGGTSYSTSINDPKKKFEKTILLGKLKTPSYLIKQGQIIAKINKEKYKFTPSKGWKITKEEIFFNKYLEDYSPRNFRGHSQLDKLIDKSKAHKSKTLEGLTINIFPSKEIKIGGSIEYDSPEKALLIIGNKRVDEYLKQENLTITKKSVEEIPKF